MFRRLTPDASPTPAEGPSDRPHRWGLYGPYIALAIAVALWSGAWWSARQTLIRHMDELISGYRASGYDFSWTQRTVSGYPFRLDVVLTQFKGVSPSGWGLTSDRLEGEAYMHAPDHWVFGAPQGLSLLRPQGGTIEVTGSTLHASIHGLDMRPPSLSVEGLNLRFKSASGTQPLALTTADKVEFHLRPGPDRQGAVLFRLINGRSPPRGPLDLIAAGRPVDLQLEAILSKADALRGPGLAKSFRTWALAGGRATLKEAKVTAGDAMIKTSPGDLSLTPDGYLSAQLDVTLNKGNDALMALSYLGVTPHSAGTALPPRSQIEGPRVLLFRKDATYLGSVQIGPGTKVF